jgi:hypothetical protein
MNEENTNSQTVTEPTPDSAAQPEVVDSGVKAIQVRMSNGQFRTQYRDSQGKIMRTPGKPKSFEARHTKGRQKFLDSRFKRDEALPEKATNAEAIDHFAMRIIERAASGDSKLGSAAASLTKRFDERSAGLAARSELDRGATSSQPIVVVITPPELMHKEILDFDKLPQPPRRPSWQLPEPGVYEPEPAPRQAEILEIRENPPKE